MQYIIYHICKEEDWNKQESNDSYSHVSLETEGFIHCSDESQVDGVLERYFDGVSDLLKLEVAVSKLTAKCIEEQATNGDFFPHIYGAINKDAILSITKIR